MSWKCVLRVLGVVIIAFSVSECTKSDNFENGLQRDFQFFFRTQIVRTLLQNTAKELDLKDMLQESFLTKRSSEAKKKLFCKTCAIGVDQILQSDNVEEIIHRASALCIKLELAPAYICNILIQENKDELLYIMSHTSSNGKDICGVVFVSQGCVSNNPARVWQVPLPEVPKPPVVQVPPPQPNSPTMKVLHLADTHYDPEYLPGGTVVCEEKYLCCRNKSESPTTNSAGFWGSYGNCDVPIWTLEAMYDYISKTNTDIDFIIWTGDLIPHDVWSNSREANLKIIHEMADLIVKYFPGIPVYPAIGNHESAPVNQFSQPYITEPEFEMSWLYNELSSIWQTWLPSEAAESVAYSAFYSVEIKPRLRLISVNTNFCYGLNWWLVLDSTDIAKELDLMSKELQKAEDKGDMVYIIGHIPPGNPECSLTWSHEFNKVVARYESTISGMFFGHTHYDHFELFFDPENSSRVIEVGFIGQSQTTYSNLNPGYKIYTVEGEHAESHFRVLDHSNWIINLDIANTKNETSLTKLYSAKEEYGLQDLSPESLLDFVMQMKPRRSTLFNKFYRNYIKASPPFLTKGCKKDCKSQLLCSLVISDNSDHSHCDKLILHP